MKDEQIKAIHKHLDSLPSHVTCPLCQTVIALKPGEKPPQRCPNCGGPKDV